VILFAATVALGAFLLFLVEPLAAKALLPLFGGTSAVWLTSLLFFQVALLAGYLFADLAARKLRPRALAWAHLALLSMAVFALPGLSRSMALAASGQLPAWLAGLSPTPQLLAMLLGSVGLPFIALAATAPLAQVLWARTSASSPYRLYALSNFASLLGLASYPFLVEPLFTLHAQARLFSSAFLLFALCAGALVWRARAAMPIDRLHANDSPAGLAGGLAAAPPSRRAQTLWLLLPGSASALLIAVTGHLTRNVAPIPLLWMLPLAAYLVSFILAFDSPRWAQRAWTAPGAVVALGFLTFANGWIPPDSHLAWSIAVLVFAFFFVATALHGELARLRPPAPGLTRFYLSIATGSALGSLFAAVLVPLCSRGLPELALSLVLCAIALIETWWPQLARLEKHALSSRAAMVIGIVVMALSLFIGERARAIGDLFAARNFYGALKVQEQLGKRGRLHVLFNGTTLHGLQLYAPTPKDATLERLAYYSERAGVGRALATLRAAHGKSSAQPRPLRVGTIGLGAGVLAAACESGDTFLFYEINPLVEEVARTQFSFLAHCAGARVKPGDARLVLAREPPQRFDLLVVDAFSSDAIPVHLLTAEAFALYLRHLAEGGVIAVHVSNRYLDLESAIAAHAAPLALRGLLVTDDEKSDDIFPSLWVLLSRDSSPLEGPAYAGAELQPIEQLAKVREWTDDYSNIASVFR